MKKYILMLLFFLNFAFNFEHGKIMVSSGIEMRAASDEPGDGYFSGWTVDDFEDFLTSGDAEELGIEVDVWFDTHEFLDHLSSDELLDLFDQSTDMEQYCSICLSTDYEGNTYITQAVNGFNVTMTDTNNDDVFDRITITGSIYFEKDINTSSDESDLSEFYDFLQQNYGSDVADELVTQMINDEWFDVSPIVNDEGIPGTDSENYFKPTETDGFPVSANTEADRIKNIMGATTDIVQNINILKGEASNNGANKYEYGIAINKNSTGFYLYNSPTNGKLQTDELVGTVGVDFNQETEVFVHNHTDPSLKTLSSTDVNSLLYQYNWIKNHGGDLKAKIEISPDQSQSMVYVHDKTKLDAFIKNYGDNLIKEGEKVFNTDKKIGKDFEKVQIELKKQGYSPSVAYRYSLTFVLDKYQSGLKIFFKEPGAPDFNQQGIQLTPYTTPSGKTNTLYTPLISK